MFDLLTLLATKLTIPPVSALLLRPMPKRRSSTFRRSGRRGRRRKLRRRRRRQRLLWRRSGSKSCSSTLRATRSVTPFVTLFRFLHVDAHPRLPQISAILQNADFTRSSLQSLRAALLNLKETSDLPPQLDGKLLDDLKEDIEALDSITDCGLAQERIANDILGLAQIQLSKYSIAPVEFDLATSLRNICRMSKVRPSSPSSIYAVSPPCFSSPSAARKALSSSLSLAHPSPVSDLEHAFLLTPVRLVSPAFASLSNLIFFLSHSPPYPNPRQPTLQGNPLHRQVREARGHPCR